MSDWLGTLGSVASLAGVVLSGLAFWKAASAAAAAKDARKAVLIRGMVEELERAAAVADYLFDFLREQRFAEARLRADDLAILLAEIPSRRYSLVDSRSRDDIQQTLLQVVSISERLSKDDGLKLPALERDRLLGIVRRYVTTRLREVVGRAKSEIDERGRA
jgi:hypothetical protein